MKNLRLLFVFCLFLQMAGSIHAKDWTGFNRYRSANEKLASVEPGEKSLVFIGNSILAELAKENSIQVILPSVLLVYDYPGETVIESAKKILALNEMIKNYAVKNGMSYLDYFSALVDERKGFKMEYITDAAK